MSDTVKLLFGVHAHQPAGNFSAVIRDARDRCYLPFLDVLEHHPDFPFSVHVSGWLLEFLAREYPDDVRRLRAMVERGQTEVFGGGDAEPVLAALPEVDRRGQIAALNARIKRRFGVRPHGAWLTERVWEATIVPSLADRGIRYVAVDDYHFLCTGLPADELHGYYATEENGRRLDLFPISEALRYKIPFAPVPDAIGYLESLPAGDAAVYFDDIEKFGIWPETHEWVYGRRWLEDFIEAVVRSPKIEPTRYGAFHASSRSRGVVYLPTVSYSEMGEWALTPRSAARFEQLLDRAKRESTFTEDKPFIRGGHWRNFLSRYPEANWMHKRMLEASRTFHALPRAARTKTMRDELHLAQANDAYWHGLFGGIYLPHLRRHVYGSLARLRGAMEAAAPRPFVRRSDIDLDGREEVELCNREMTAVIRPAEGACVCEWSHYGLAHNFADTLARRAEQYFDKVRAGPVATVSSAPASIHGRIAFRTQISHEDLQPDSHPRALFVDFWHPSDGEETMVRYQVTGNKSLSQLYRGEVAGLGVAKRIALTAHGPSARYDLSCARQVRGAFVVELNLAMPSCDGPGGQVVIDGSPTGGFAQPARRDAVSSLELTDTELSRPLRLDASPPASMSTQPLCTVSQSEAGFEKIMQAVTVRIRWDVELEAGHERALSVGLKVRSR